MRFFHRSFKVNMRAPARPLHVSYGPVCTPCMVVLGLRLVRGGVSDSF